MAEAPKRVRTRHFARAKEQGIKITGLTSYDVLTAQIFDEAGIDFLLVGDSAGNTVLGYDTTLPVTIDDLIPLTRGVVNGVKRALVVADMPFGSYETGPEEALHTAFRFMKETGAHAVKLEGGVRSAKQIRRIVSAGIPVMAHIGFTPQSEHGLGGHVIQGRGEAAEQLLAERALAQTLDDLRVTEPELETIRLYAAAYTAGELNQRIIIESRANTTQNALGENTTAWAAVLTSWAKAEPLRLLAHTRELLRTGELLRDVAASQTAHGLAETGDAREVSASEAGGL